MNLFQKLMMTFQFLFHHLLSNTVFIFSISEKSVWMDYHTGCCSTFLQLFCIEIFRFKLYFSIFISVILPFLRCILNIFKVGLALFFIMSFSLCIFPVVLMSSFQECILLIYSKSSWLCYLVWITNSISSIRKIRTNCFLSF